MKTYSLHAENPQQRLLGQIVEQLKQGDLGAIPTDSGYALICSLDNAAAKERIERFRQLSKSHFFSILCHNVNIVSNFAKLNNHNFRLVRQSTPGPYTFVLPATNEVPKRLLQPKRRTVGIRIPQHPAPLSICEVLNDALMSTSLRMPDADEMMYDPNEVSKEVTKQVDFLVICEPNHIIETTVVDCCEQPPVIIRQGAGSFD